MRIPDTLSIYLRFALHEVESHPLHALQPRLRRTIYDSFGSRQNAEVNTARSWLAIMSAQKVLPLFEHGYPRITFPRKMLDAAIECVRGTKNKALTVKLLDYGYAWNGHGWVNMIGTQYDGRAEDAGMAAVQALHEAMGFEPLQGMDVIVRLRQDTRSNVTSIYTSEPWLSQKPLPPQDIVRGDALTDADIRSIFMVADAASPAAIAWATTPRRDTDDTSNALHEYTIDPLRMKEFWEWWLTEAIPQAWAMVEE